MSDSEQQSEFVELGHINGVFGIKGWVKVFSHTSPRENIFNYSPWYLKNRQGEWQKVEFEDSRKHGKGLIAKLPGFETPETARQLIGTTVGIQRQQMADKDDGYYWIDLVGCQVKNLEEETLGKVAELIETGANDVLIVKGDQQRLIPFVTDVIIKQVDIKARLIIVDWQKDF